MNLTAVALQSPWCLSGLGLGLGLGLGGSLRSVSALGQAGGYRNEAGLAKIWGHLSNYMSYCLSIECFYIAKIILRLFSDNIVILLALLFLPAEYSRF